MRKLFGATGIALAALGILFSGAVADASTGTSGQKLVVGPTALNAGTYSVTITATL